MKIDEVMMGDIVSASGRPIHVTLAVLNNWSDNIKPIPLTPEILEKNGFNDTSFEANHKYKYVIHTNEYQLGYYPKTNSFNVYKKGIDPFYTKDVFCCGFQNIVKYVHELQHALKLCGIDKEIVV